MVELSVAASLFLVVTTILLTALFQGVRVWKLGDQRSDLVNSAQAVFSDVGWELESSHLDGVEWSDGPGILSFVSPFGTRESSARDAFMVDPVSGNLRWSKYVVIFHDTGSHQIKKREWKIPAGTVPETVPQPLSVVDLGFGPRPLSFYADDGRVLSRHVREFGIERIGRTVEIHLKLENEDRSFQFTASTLVRN